MENEKEERAREYREKAGNLGSEELKSEERFVIKTKNNFVLGNEKEEKTRVLRKEKEEKTSEYKEKSREKSQLPAI